MNFKICVKCNLSKNPHDFHKDKSKKSGLSSYCKICSSERKKTKYYENIELTRNTYRIIRKKQRDKDRVGINQKRREYYRHKMETDPLFKLKKNVRNRIWFYTKYNGKSKTTFEIVGIEVDKLKIYLENKFTEGMTWENYGPYGWHIDHIIPLDSAKTKEELYKLCNYKNLQPLWWNDNIRKGPKILVL
jgi:hypothetical protein